MKLRIEKLGRASFAAHARGHIVVSDQPQENGGADVGMTPPELLLASLGTCVAYYVAQFCEPRLLDCDAVEIEVEGDLMHNPGRIGAITVKVALPVELDEDRLKALLRAVSHCTIHNTLTAAPDIRVHVETPVAAMSS